MTGPYLVVVPEQRMPPPAAVLQSIFVPELGSKRIPLPNHKVAFCAVSTLEESLYLAAFINSTPMQVLLESFASDTAVSPTTMARLPIPAFDPNSPTCLSLVSESKAVHFADSIDKETERKVRQPAMDLLVTDMLTAAGSQVGTVMPRTPGSRTRRRDTLNRDSGQQSLDLGGIFSV